MEEEKKNQAPQTEETQPETQEAQPRPNRDAYAKMYSEDYPDADFEDKESRYGNLIKDRETLRSLSKSGKQLSSVIGKNRWLAAMIQDLANDESGTLDPFTWMAENGVDVMQAMEDEEYRGKISSLVNDYIQKQSDGEAAENERADNLSNIALKSLQDLQDETGMSDEECSELWGNLFNDIVGPAFRGEVTKETWELLRKAKGYDNDIASAREEAAIQARNEKIDNKLTQGKKGVPPTLSQGGGGRAQRQPKREGMFDDVEEMFG